MRARPRLPAAACGVLLSAAPALQAGELVSSGAGAGEPAARAARPPPAAVWFEDATRSAGIDFTHVRALETRYWLPEIMSGGAGWCDVDGDGRLDLYLVQGGALGTSSPGAPGNRLYRNLGNGRFVDVTEGAGVGDTSYGMGVACGDIDSDGDVDIYVTNVGPNVLYRNEGDGTFRDVTDVAGVGDDGWGTSSAFFDYDADGDLDLFVVNYIHWSPDEVIECHLESGQRDYCHPNNYQAPASDRLYRNDGAGVFTDVSSSSGIAMAFGNGLGVGVGDFDDDGWLDVFVDNDGTPNQLWLNQRGERFLDQALLSGTAVNRSGGVEAGMGVAIADLDADGDLDLFSTHLRGETNTLYRNDAGFFDDVTAAAGLAAPSLDRTGFGAGFHDFDHDGRLDLYVVNGRVGGGGRELVAGEPFAEPNALFHQVAAGRFEEVDPPGGTRAPLIENSRAAAFADYDDDGDVDIVVVNNGGAVRLLENVAVKRGAWVGFRLRDARGLETVGARVRVEAGERQYRGVAQAAYSYCATNDPRAHLGLGDVRELTEVSVRWPDGVVERFGPRPVGAYHELRRGEGR